VADNYFFILSLDGVLTLEKLLTSTKFSAT